MLLGAGILATLSLHAQTGVPGPSPRQPASATPGADPATPAPASPVTNNQPATPGKPDGSLVPAAPAKLDQVSQIIGSKVLEEFFRMLHLNQIDEAYDRLTAGTPIADKPEDVATLKSKTREALKVFGAISGHELIAAQSVGTRLMSATYVSLGKTFPLRWRFYFYRPEKAWKLIDIRVDDRLEDMFDEKSAPSSVTPRA